MIESKMDQFHEGSGMKRYRTVQNVGDEEDLSRDRPVNPFGKVERRNVFFCLAKIDVFFTCDG